MDNLFFPQLASGALAQYPLRKTRIARTIRNVLPDGSMLLAPDANATKLVWQLAYTALSSQELNALTAHFTACQGRLKAFTFIDPADNLLASSSNFLNTAWQTANTITCANGAPDPYGTLTACTATNNGQVNAEISQTLIIPAAFQYCFSVYAVSATNSTLAVVRRGSATEESQTLSVGPRWTRLVASGHLVDPGTRFTVAISLRPGQQISLFGPQLEAQLLPSRFRKTVGAGGVYPNAHWAIDELPVSADAPDLFSTAFSIETAV